MASAENPYAGQGAVLLDIGDEVGALVVTMPAELAGVEVEIGRRRRAVDHHDHDHQHAHGPAHDHHHRPHVAVGGSTADRGARRGDRGGQGVLELHSNVVAGCVGGLGAKIRAARAADRGRAKPVYREVV